jgi:putative polyhydroxyalkanoate system protein
VSDIHIERNHTLGIDRAREVARQWTGQAEQDYGMECLYTEGPESDVAKFSRPGMEGSVEVTAHTLTLHMTLGFLMDAFKGIIEEKVTRNLDEMLAGQGNARA